MTNEAKHFFLVIEGIDGSGKTAVSRRLVQVLQATLKDRVKLTFEPHDPSCAGLFIRQALMKKIKVSPRVLALAFAVNRADHLAREVDPFLDFGDHSIVVCDRYYLSSLVYQSTADLPISTVMALNSGARRPDLTIFLDVSDKVSYERMRRRAEDKELFERSLAETRRKYRAAIQYVKEAGESVVEVNADAPIGSVLHDVVGVLHKCGPDWLIIQEPMPENTLPEVFSLNGTPRLSIGEVMKRFSHFWAESAPADYDELERALAVLRDAVKHEISTLSYNELGALFLDYLSLSGYKVGQRLPWTDLDAYELEYQLPLQIPQRGTALLIGQSQRLDILLKKYLALEQLSDFMLVFDPGPTRLISQYYERGLVQYSADNTSLAPETRVVSMGDISNMVLTSAYKRAAEAFTETGVMLNVWQSMQNIIDREGLNPYWTQLRDLYLQSEVVS
jgi:dTMP kinase